MKKKLFLDPLNREDSTFFKELKNFDKDGIFLENNFDKLIISFKPEKTELTINGFPISDFNTVIINSWGRESELAHTLSILPQKIDPSIVVVDKSNALGKIVGSKLFQLARFYKHSLRFPKSVFVSRDLLNEKDIYNKIKEEIGSNTFITKSTLGTYGKGITIINNKEEFQVFLTQIDTSLNYIFQEYIPHDVMYRVVVIDNKVVSIQKTYKNDSSFIINVHNECEQEFVSLNTFSDTNLNKCIEITKEFEYRVAGLDVTIIGEDELCIFEINSNPGMRKNTDEYFAYYKWVMSF